MSYDPNIPVGYPDPAADHSWESIGVQDPRKVNPGDTVHDHSEIPHTVIMVAEKSEVIADPDHPIRKYDSLNWIRDTISYQLNDHFFVAVKVPGASPLTDYITTAVFDYHPDGCCLYLQLDTDDIY